MNYSCFRFQSTPNSEVSLWQLNWIVYNKLNSYVSGGAVALVCSSLLATNDVYACTARSLGRVDGFEQDEGRGDGDDGPEVSCSLLASLRHAFEAFQLSHHLLDAGAAPIESLGEARLDRLTV